MRVLLTTNLPSPYMVDYLNELGKLCELTAIFERRSADDRDDSWYGDTETCRFHAVFCRSIRFGAEAGLTLEMLPYLSKRRYDRIIIANPTTPTGILALLYCRWFHVPFCIQSEGGFHGDGQGLKERFKKYIMEKADFYLTGMGGKNDYFLAYGATPDRLRPYPFTSMRQCELETAPAGAKKKAELREALGLPEGVLILSVGRILPGKGFDLLLEAASGFQGMANVCIVGGEPTAAYLQYMQDNGVNHVSFVPFSSPAAVKRYYLAADVFVLPTRYDTWGLVVNEAMANGLPVVTTDMCVAGLSLIENGVNGYIVPVDDADALRDALTLLIRDRQLREDMAKANLEKIQRYSIENMAHVIYDYISAPFVAQT